MAVATRNERVYNFVGREMLRGSIAALSHEIFNVAEVLQVIRDILAQQLSSSPGPREVGPAHSPTLWQLLCDTTLLWYYT